MPVAEELGKYYQILIKTLKAKILEQNLQTDDKLGFSYNFFDLWKGLISYRDSDKSKSKFRG